MSFLNFFDGMQRQEKENRRVADLEKELQSARLRGEDHCVRCGFCCHRRTCIPTPIEILVIADYLGLTAEELIKAYLVIDRRSFGGPYYLRPAGVNIKDLMGQFIPSSRTFNEGPCIFLEEGFLEKENNMFRTRCLIYDVRPQSSREYDCWNEQIATSNPEIDAWKDNKLATFVINDEPIDGEREEDIARED